MEQQGPVCEAAGRDGEMQHAGGRLRASMGGNEGA